MALGVEAAGREKKDGGSAGRVLVAMGVAWGLSGGYWEWCGGSAVVASGMFATKAKREGTTIRCNGSQ